VDVQPPAALWQKLQLVPAALGWNLSSIAWPFPLSAVRDVRLAPGWTGWVGGLVILGVVVGAGRRRAAWAGIGLLILAPALALPTVLDGYLVAERYMYPALVGLGLWAAHVLPGPRRTSEWAGAGLVGALCLGASIHRAPAWQSDQALFQAATAAEPESSLAWHLLGMTYLRRGASLDAADAFGRAVESGHPYPGDRTHKLRALVEAGLPEEALAWAEAGPKEGLSAAHLAWWARAAFEAGQRERAAELLAVLRTPGGLDGPAWLRQLAVQIDKSDSGTDQEADQGP
jgi:tetratricopeptide (TPR) repeat protein